MIAAKPLSQMQSSTLRWLFEPYLQRGRLAILDGDPAVGKSLISIDLAARLSRGATITQAIERPQVTILLARRTTPPTRSGRVPRPRGPTSTG